MKLTPLQAQTLRRIEAGEVSQQRFGYAAWRIVGATPSVVGRVISAGLACWNMGTNEKWPCILTAAGRAALAMQEQADG